MLGFRYGYPTVNNNFGPVPAVGPGMDDVECSGNETDIRSCPHLALGNCGPTEGAGVRCYTPPPPEATGGSRDETV